MWRDAVGDSPCCTVHADRVLASRRGRLCPRVVLERIEGLQAIKQGGLGTNHLVSAVSRARCCHALPALTLRRRKPPTWPVSGNSRRRRFTRSAAQQLGAEQFARLFLADSLDKSPPKQPSAAGATKSYSTPAKPATPEVPDAAALAKDLEAYDNATTPVDSPTSKSSSSSATSEGEDGAEGADEYLRLVEADVVKDVKH